VLSKYVVVDNCCQAQGTIQEVFSDKMTNGEYDTSVVKDVKHLIKRPPEEMVKTPYSMQALLLIFMVQLLSLEEKLK
jgi:hypothetical protein